MGLDEDFESSNVIGSDGFVRDRAFTSNSLSEFASLEEFTNVEQDYLPSRFSAQFSAQKPEGVSAEHITSTGFNGSSLFYESLGKLNWNPILK